MASSVEESRVAIAGPYGASFLRALCPPMTGDPKGPLDSDCHTRKIIENYVMAIIYITHSRLLSVSHLATLTEGLCA